MGAGGSRAWLVGRRRSLCKGHSNRSPPQPRACGSGDGVPARLPERPCPTSPGPMWGDFFKNRGRRGPDARWGHKNKAQAVNAVALSWSPTASPRGHLGPEVLPQRNSEPPGDPQTKGPWQGWGEACWSPLSAFQPDGSDGDGAQ